MNNAFFPIFSVDNRAIIVYNKVKKSKGEQKHEKPDLHQERLHWTVLCNRESSQVWRV